MEDEDIKELTTGVESGEESDAGDSSDSGEHENEIEGHESKGEGTEEMSAEVANDPTKIQKETLNTLIISLRPCIAQAKVHIIHKLAKQVAGLKKKKCGNDQEKVKNERKVGRFVDEISILKRANKDMISRWLVVNNKTFAEVTKRETLTQQFNLKVRVFVRAGEHQSVRKVLDSFRIKYPLWEEEVPTVLRTLGKKKKKTDPNNPNDQELGIKPLKKEDKVEDKIKEANKIKESMKKTSISDKASDVVVNPGNQSDSESEDDVVNPGNQSDSESEDKQDESDTDKDAENESKEDVKNEDSGDSESDTDDGIVHHNENENNDNGSEEDENIFAVDGHVFDKDDPANYSESDVEDRGSESEGETDSGDEEIFVSSLKEALKMSGDGPSKEEQAPATEKPGKINKKSGEMVVKVLDLKNVEDNEESEDESSTLVETDNSKKKISSFFVGGESESEEEADGEYDEESLAYGEDVLQMRQESLKNKFHKEGRAGVGLNGQWGRGRGNDGGGGGRGRGSDDRGRGRGRGNDDRGRGRGNGKFENSRGRGRGDFERGRGRGRGDFQMRGRGRGDFNRGGRGTSFNESRGGDFTSSSINNSVKSAEVDVHPSWAAKKRQNTTIAKFEGKKIKFGDDGGYVNSSKPAYVPPVVKAPPTAAPSEKLHPSWAAKQNQKTSIQAFQGKKVVFGD